jgi:hypothetical protein
MIRAAGILGSDDIIRKLHGSLRSKGIELERRNIRYLDELLDLLRDNPDIEAVLIVERGLRAEAPVFTDALEAIRVACPVVRIIFVMDSSERDYDFEVWCYDRGIYDVFYPGRHMDVNIDAISDTIRMGRIDQDNPPPPPADPNIPLIVEDRSGMIDRIKGINLSEFKLPSLPDFNLPSLSDFMRRRQSVNSSEVAGTPEYRVIGVINSSRGLGATTLVAGMANLLRDAGYSVAVMALDLKSDLHFSGLAERGVTVSIPAGDEMDCWEKLAEAHDFLLFDFGIVFDFLPSGACTPAAQRAKEARAVQTAMEFCDMKLYLYSDEPWHVNKVNAFESDDNGFTVNTKEADALTILSTLGII